MATANIFCIKLKTLIFPQVLEHQNITIKKFNNAVFCKLDSSPHYIQLHTKIQGTFSGLLYIVCSGDNVPACHLFM